MSILTWSTQLTDINAKGRAEAKEFPSSLGLPCQSHFRAYSLTFTSCSSQVARSREFTTWRPGPGPMACGGDGAGGMPVLRSPPILLLPSIFYTKNTKALICPLPYLNPSNWSQDKSHTSQPAIQGPILCDTHQPIQGSGLSCPHIYSCSSHIGPPWFPSTMHSNSLPPPSSRHAPLCTSTDLHTPLSPPHYNLFYRVGRPWGKDCALFINVHCLLNE